MTKMMTRKEFFKTVGLGASALFLFRHGVRVHREGRSKG